MASLVYDPTALIAVSWYSPALSGPTFVIVKIGLPVLVSDSFPSAFSKSIGFSFFVQKKSWIPGESSKIITLPIKFTDLFLMFVSGMISIYGGPRNR